MNTLNTPTIVMKALLASLITLNIVGGAAAIADQVGPNLLTKKVSFQDLDLSTVQGQRIARQRVDRLARDLCTRVVDPTDMSAHTNYLACVDATLAKAGESLQALITKQSNVQFARVDVN